jgi:hypothetical protein
MRPLVLAFSLSLVAVSGCAGRPPQQIATVQPQDRYSDCFALSAEISSNDQKLQSLGVEQSNKVAQNVAAGVAGLLIWPLWFAMDFQGAASQDAEAIRGRQQYLQGLMAQNRCGASS